MAARARRALSVAASVALLLGACGTEPPPTVAPSSAVPSAAITPGPSVSEIPFQPAAWPSTGSACGLEGYAGLMGRIEAVDSRTVRFTLCRPDGAFPARVAQPSLAVLDAAALEALAADRDAARSLAGTGAYRIARWEPGADVVLEAVGSADPSLTPTVVIRWASESAQRTYELQAATVDGIDDPGPLDVERIETQPELTLVPRPGLATAYLAFQAGGPFADARVRRAFALGLDRASLVEAAFPAGSAVPERVVPCAIAGACGGEDWAAFDAPAAAAALGTAGFDMDRIYDLHVPARPIPGLPDPVGVATAVQEQLGRLGVDVTIDEMSLRDYADALAAGDLDGFYLGGVASSVADPSAFLDPLVGRTAAGRLRRLVPDVPALLEQARAAADPAARAATYAEVNEALRDLVPLVPLAHPGSVAAFRTDVTGVAASPLGEEALGSFAPGDRRQLVFMQSSEPRGAYCGDQASTDAARVCALVTDGLYGYAAATATPEPRLARSCAASDDATTWTCTLVTGVRFHDGTTLDAGDVLASFVAQWDAGSALRAANPQATFAGWSAAFGATLAAPGG